MIHWTMTKISDGVEGLFEIVSGENYLVKEMDLIQFIISMPSDMFDLQGEPCLVVGDIPLEVRFSHKENGFHFFKTASLYNQGDSRIFYNFFGKSDVVVYFLSGVNNVITATFDIMARRENAELADTMLDYLTNNIEDAISICFSRSKKEVVLTEFEQFNFTKLDVIKDIVRYLDSEVMVFIREHKYSFLPKLDISTHGQPTGPDSVYWALSNLDKLTPSNDDDVNLIFGNRSYKFSELPKESLVNDTDVFENRVINSFLIYTLSFLTDLMDSLFLSDYKEMQSQGDDYVRFDHTMSKYTTLVLKHKYSEIKQLAMEVERLRCIFQRVIPSKTYAFLSPKITSYVAKHYHYRNIFILISNCYQAPSPSFEGNQLLLGLKNLAIIYELCSLVMLNTILKNQFGAKSVEQSFRSYQESGPFLGMESKRPIGFSNNYFSYSFDRGFIEILYEPKIYPFSEITKHGDIVDTSRTNRNEYGAHHYCPDFILRFHFDNNNLPLVIVLDSKYKEAKVVKEYDIPELTRKYLLNLHQVSFGSILKLVPISLLLILFPHDKSGRSALTVSNRHSVIGEMPVYPQAAGILFKPNYQEILEKYIVSTVEYFELN